MSSRQPIDKFEEKIVKTLLNEHQRAENLAKRLKDIYNDIDQASTAGKTTPTGIDETADNAKTRLNNALKSVLDKLKAINISDVTNMVANTSIDDLGISDETNSNENKEKINDASNNSIKSYKLDSNTKTFSGNPGERLSHWLFIINDAFTAQNVPTDQIKLSLVTNYLKGSAFNALIRYRKNKDPTWTGFEELLKSQFEDSNLDYKIRTQFFHLKMTESFSKYLARFQELLNQMSTYDENDTDILYKFTDGLVKEYALAVRRDRCETLQDAIKVCQDIDCLSKDYNTIGQSHESLNKVKRINFSNINVRQNKMPNRNYSKINNNYSKNRYERKPYQNGINNSNQSKSNNFKNSKIEKKKVDLSNVTCFKCKSKGHYSSRCLKFQSNNPIANSNKSKKIFSINVYTEVNNETNLLNTSGTINGIPTKMTLDSGATTCVLSEQIARKHNFKILNSDVLVKLAHNEVVKVVGITEKLHVEVKGHTCDIEMYVLPNSDFECLLGLNWFLEMKVSLTPADRTIKFKSETYSLDDNEPLFEYDHENVLLSSIDFNNDEEIDIQTEWNANPFKGIKPELELTKDELKKVKLLSEKIKDGFALTYEDLRICTILPYKIHLNSDMIVHVPQYRRSIQDDEVIGNEVEKLLKSGMISVSNSPYSSPCLVVPKKDGSKRVVIDFRRINAITIPENLPIPLVQDIFDRLSGCTYISLCDLCKGYNQCILSPESRKYTAFMTKRTKYEWNVLAFGLRNACGFFNRLMDMVLGHLPFVAYYFDDLVIFSQDFESHCKHIEQVFNALEKANLKVNPDKCKFFANKINLLGHVISGKTIECDPAKIEAIIKREPPRNVKELQIFLGCSGYYRNLIQNYAKHAKPLYDLVKKDNKFIWGEEQKIAFETLKKKLSEYPVLRMPVLDRQFLIYTDCSGYHIGAVLTQVCPDTNTEYVVSYASRSLKNAERFYSATEREALAIIWAIGLWRVYLYKQFVVVTDAKAVTYIMNSKSPNLRLNRWFIFVQSFDFILRYRKGKENTVPDCLSRPPKNENDLRLPVESLDKNYHKINSIFCGLCKSKDQVTSDDEDEPNSRNVDPHDDIGLLYFIKNGRHLSGLPKKQHKRIKKLADHFKFENEKLFYRKNISNQIFLTYPNLQERDEILVSYHNLGHFATEATYKRILEKYYWKGMYKDVEKFVKRCLTCQ